MIRRLPLKYLLFVLLLVVVIYPLAFPNPSLAQDTPQNVREGAISALNAAIPGIGRPDAWRHVGPQSTQLSSLGCSGTPEFSLQAPVVYYQVFLKYADLEYQINITESANSYVYCDSKIPGSFNYIEGSGGTTTSGTCTLTTTAQIQTREQPNTSAAFNGTIAIGQIMPVVGTNADKSWYRIYYSGANAYSWIENTGVVTLAGNCTSLQIVADNVNTQPVTNCTVSANQSNIRANPSVNAQIVETGDLANTPVIGRTADNRWFQVDKGWLASSVAVTAGNCSTVPVTAAAEIDFGNCPVGFSGYMNSRLQVGDTGIVEDGNVPNRVRQEPSLAAEILFQLQPGEEFDVINGPQCGNGIVWWQVQEKTQQAPRLGWTAESNVETQEYYVDVVQKGINANGIVNINNIQFTYPPTLASDIVVEIVAPEVRNPADEENLPYWVGHPGYRDFVFLDFIEENSFDPLQPYIRIYPTDTMFTYNEVFYNQWVALSAELQDQTKYSTDTVVELPQDFPSLPIRNAAQVFLTQLRYVEFQNGVGIRYITRFAQAPIQTTNDVLMYGFQGLTYDNKYYVVAWFPISASILQDSLDYTNLTEEGMQAIINAESGIYGQLALLNPTDFSPNLQVLDDILASLNVR